MARPKKSKAEKIRDLLAKGFTAPEIVNKTGASPAYVYTVRKKLALENTPAVGDPRDQIPAGSPPSWFSNLIHKLAFWR